MSSTAVGKTSYDSADYDSRMVNVRRMQDVQARNTQILADMLVAVLRRAHGTAGPSPAPSQTGCGSGNADEEEAAGGSAAASAAHCDKVTFEGYSPELVSRAVHSLVVLQNTDALSALLTTHFTGYGEEVRRRLRQLCVTLGLPPATATAPPDGNGGTGNSNNSSSDDSSGDGGKRGGDAAESGRKRRRLGSVGAPGEPPRGDGLATSASAHRCYAALVGAWQGLTRAADEIQTVWAPFACECRFGSIAPRSSGEAGEARASRSVALPPRRVAAGTTAAAVAPHTGGQVLHSAILFLAEAVAANQEVLDTAIAAYVEEVVRDARLSHPVPTGSSSAAAAAPENEEEGEEGRGATAPPVGDASRAKSREAICAFTDLCIALNVYVPRVRGAVVRAVHDHYTAAAAQMRGDGRVDCLSYYRYAAAAVAAEEARARQYLHPNTAPLLVEAAETALLGEAGAAVVSRDFAALFAEGASAPATEDVLGLVWTVLSASTHVSRDHIVQLFRKHLDGRNAEAVAGIVAAAGNHPSTTTAPNSGSGGAAGANPLSAVKAAVVGLTHVVRDARRVVARSFPRDQRVFLSQLDESLQACLRPEPQQQLIAEMLAVYVDDVFRRLERGQLRLSAPKQGGVTAAAATVAASPTGKGARANEEEEPEAEAEGEEDASASAAAAAAEEPTGEETLAMVAFLCSHFPSMETFEQLHWRDMARRLLHPDRNVNFDAEQCFLRIFEGICGNSFISKFEGMISDMNISRELTTQYREWVHSRGSLALVPPTAAASAPRDAAAVSEVTAEDFDALPKHTALALHFITSGLWPKCTPLPLTLPAPMQRTLANVELYYSRLFAKRLLRWQHQLSYGVVEARMRPGAAPRQLSGTLLQCVMLLHMDRHLAPGGAVAAISVADLCAGLGVAVDAPEVVGALLGLCQPRLDLVVRRQASGQPPGAASGPVAPTDTLAINDDVVFATARVRIPFLVRADGGKAAASAAASPSSAASPTTPGAVGEEVDEEQLFFLHGHMLQIALVQFMKSRGTAKHDDLVAHLQGVRLPFVVTMAFVKKTLDRMIDRGFIAREGSDSYRYVA